MTIRLFLFVIAVVAPAGGGILSFLASPAFAAASTDPAAVCAAAKLKAAGATAQHLLGCQGKAAGSGGTVAQKCIDSANQKLTAAFDAADAGGGCGVAGNAGTVDSQLQSFMTSATTALRPNSTASKCTALKLKAVGVKVGKLLGATSKDRIEPDAGKFLKAALSLQAAFVKKFDGAEKKGDCETTGDADAVDAQADAFIALAIGALQAVGDVSFPNVTISTVTPVPVTLNGQLSAVPASRDILGQVTATYGTGGQATMNFTAGLNVSIVVAGHTVTVALQSVAFTIDGAPQPAEDVIQAFWNDSDSTADPALWASTSQALLALAAVLATPSFSVDLIALEDGPAGFSPQSARRGGSVLPAVATGGGQVGWCWRDALYKNLVARNLKLNCLKLSLITGGGGLCLLIPVPDPVELANQCCAEHGCPCVGAADCASGDIQPYDAITSVNGCSFGQCLAYPFNCRPTRCVFGSIRSCLPPETPVCCGLNGSTSCSATSGLQICYGASGTGTGRALSCAETEANFDLSRECNMQADYAHTMLPGETCGGWTCCGAGSGIGSCSSDPAIYCP